MTGLAGTMVAGLAILPAAAAAATEVTGEMAAGVQPATDTPVALTPVLQPADPDTRVPEAPVPADSGRVAPLRLGPVTFGPPVAGDGASPAARSNFVVPDLTGLTRLLPRLETPLGSARIGLELIGDWTAFAQDPISLDQVGQQNDQFQMRSASIGISGRLGRSNDIRYSFELQYNGFNANPDQNWTLSDFSIRIDLDRWQTLIDIGQIRGNFSYEVVGSFVNMPHAERTMSPFSAPRNPGIRAVHAIGADKRMTVALSLYKDQAESAGGSFGGAARFTALVFGPGDDGNGYLHLGASLLRSGSDAAARYRARPGSDVADFFVDTGEFAVNGATNIGLEALYSDGRGWSVQAEYVVARVDSTDFGNLGFRGFYALGSWVPTGEFRAYDRNRGVAGRIEPRGRWGAPELYARWSMVDLGDGAIQGGQYDRLEVGLNWWATREWKFGIVAGRVWLDRLGQTGVTDTMLTRLQWVY